MDTQPSSFFKVRADEFRHRFKGNLFMSEPANSNDSLGTAASRTQRRATSSYWRNLVRTSPPVCLPV